MNRSKKPRKIKPVDIPTGGRPQKHPWDTWFGVEHGQWYMLTRGKDFQCQLNTLTTAFRQQARRRDVTVSIACEGDDFKFCITPTSS